MGETGAELDLLWGRDLNANADGDLAGSGLGATIGFELPLILVSGFGFEG